MRITCIIVLYLLCLPIRSAAQQHAYTRSVQLYRDNKLDSAGYYARQAIGLYTKTARKDSLVLAYTQQALITWDAKSAEAALKIMDTAIRLSKQLPAQHVATVAAFSRAGQIYVQQQDFNKAATLLQFAAQAVPERDTMNRHIVFLYNNTAILYLMQDEYDKARPWAQRAYQLNLKLQGKDGQDMPSLLQTNYYISQYSEQYQQALAEGKELQRVMLLHYPPGHRAIGILHNSLGNIYEALLQYEEALYHRRKALDIQFANYQQKKNNGFSLASAYQNLGNLYSYINEHFLAQEYLAKGSAIFEQVYGPDEAGMIKILVGVADNKRKLGAWTEAEKLFGRAYALQQKHGPTDADAMAYVETFYGDLYLDQQQFAKAEQYYRLALKHFEQAGAMQTRLALQTQEALATVLSGKGQYDAALHLSKR
ncbi:tetratricopeptide repeat protein [Chitinophaga sedimenti]|uniref:tetratricopeptide repeat protein n=1 Tax=Chitinophaga sedimenti TaxID=2033606 RepID=UPI0020066FA2|nr:tetratricopeptide repeat protein [Chitinophaga sedimenti]MCK7554723.1 tetratricopeptide repeat protein [Chitinophaga sedimenti]